MNKKAFTLVELIVVITILSVLATVAFISFQWYASSSRDSVRLADIKSIQKVNTIFKETKGKYPLPNEEINIFFSWATAWTQWVFWTNSYSDTISMWNVPTDPLTFLPYAYSVTNTRQEYQLAAVLENQISSTLSQSAYAWDQLAEIYIKWDYNGQFLKVQTWALDYLLWVPSILASDINSVDVMDIINAKRLVYKWYNNLPASYSWSIYNNNGWFDFSPNKVVLFEWDIDDFENDPSERLDFLDNLEENYSGTEIASEDEIAEILEIKTGSPIAADQYIVNILNNSLKTNIPVVVVPTIQSDIYHDMLTIMETKYANWEINGLINLDKIHLYNNKLYFWANDNSNWNWLWVSDGTEAWTKFLSGISWNIQKIINYQNNIYVYSLESNTLHVYKSDWITPWMNMIVNQSSVYWLSNIIVHNNFMLFVSNNLYASDGTAIGTIQLAQANMNRDLVIYNNDVFFSWDSWDSGLWKTNGTVIWTSIIQSFGSDLSMLLEFNGNLYFGARWEDWRWLYKSDWTSAGSFEILAWSLVPEGWVGINNKFYIRDAYNFDRFESDWTVSGTINSAIANIIWDYLYAPESSNYHVKNTNLNLYTSKNIWWNTHLFKFEKDSLSESDIYNFNSNIWNIKFMEVYNNELYFTWPQGLWKTDWTTSWTLQVHNLNVISTWIKAELSVYNNIGYFIWNDWSGIKVWSTKGTNSSTQSYNLPIVYVSGES